jgi:hypothetical protein
VPVAPLPFLHIHATPFQLRAQGIQHADIERDERKRQTKRMDEVFAAQTAGVRSAMR